MICFTRTEIGWHGPVHHDTLFQQIHAGNHCHGAECHLNKITLAKCNISATVAIRIQSGSRTGIALLSPFPFLEH